LTTLLPWILILLLAVQLAKVLWRPEEIYEYPQLIAATFVIFILPQAVSLLRFPGSASDEAVSRVLGMACLCMLAAMAGYACPSDFQKGCRAPLVLDLRKLLQVGLLFVACGIGCDYELGTREPETTEFGGWTGRATIFGFFQQLSYPGFAICLLVCLHKPGAISVASAIVGAIVPLQSILFGRREPAAAFALIVGLTLYFRFRIKPARWLVLGGIVLGMIAIPATGTYRQFHLEKDWQSIRQIDLVGNFRQYLDEESVLELRNAAMLIEGTRRSGGYEWGAGYWNHLVFRYVPAQILGQGFKEGLKLKTPVDLVERELSVLGYANPVGSTVTCLGDSFQQFGYCGCLFFAVLGLFFRVLWRSAMAGAATLPQLLYIMVCPSAMRAVTHWTLDFLPGFLYSALFLGLAAWYAHRRAPCGPPTRGTRQAISAAYRPDIVATIKISTAPPRPPPINRYNSE
jgi:hypothetical protein